MGFKRGLLTWDELVVMSGMLAEGQLAAPKISVYVVPFWFAAVADAMLYLLTFAFLSKMPIAYLLTKRRAS